MKIGTEVHKSMKIMFTNFGLVTGKNEDVRFVQTHIITLFFKKIMTKEFNYLKSV